MHRFAVAGTPSAVFASRRDAGRQLAGRLEHLRPTRPVVLGLPRGGVAVAAEVAAALEAPLDVALVRKLGVPYQPELAVGAIGEGGVRVLNEEIRRAAGVSVRDLEAVEARERRELERQARVFREGRPPLDVHARTVVLVDDGIATGSTARAAARIARARGAARVVLATPVAPLATLTDLRGAADEIVCVRSPEPFFAIGQWYADFSQTTDGEVVALLRDARGREAEGKAPADRHPPVVLDEEVRVAVGGGVRLTGSLAAPVDARATVVFAHGSGSSRASPRNRRVASRLWASGLATLLFDLLDEGEAGTRDAVFDIERLGRRLDAATRWVAEQPGVAGLPVGAFGASTGAAAAVWAAAEPASPIGAVVTRGGRSDLAGARLGMVRCPTLLVVGSLDTVVLELNAQARRGLVCPSRLEVVQGAGHLFEEDGSLDTVAGLAADWFVAHLAGSSARTRSTAGTPGAILRAGGHERKEPHR